MGPVMPKTTDPSGSPVHYGHLPGVWDEVALHANGRAGVQFVGLLASPNPYRDWDIADRYRDGTAITDSVTRRHLQAAIALESVYQRATINGALP